MQLMDGENDCPEALGGEAMPNLEKLFCHNIGSRASTTVRPLSLAPQSLGGWGGVTLGGTVDCQVVVAVHPAHSSTGPVQANGPRWPT